MPYEFLHFIFIYFHEIEIRFHNISRGNAGHDLAPSYGLLKQQQSSHLINPVSKESIRHL